MMYNFILVALIALFPINGASLAAENDVFEIETEGSCHVEPDSSVEIAKKVAFFTALRKAVDVVGKYLSSKSIIPVYELNRDEIYSLATRETQAQILEEKQEKAGKVLIYRLGIRARIQASDFIKAEMKDIEQRKKDSKESYQEEMEQPVSVQIDPALDIAKAYRLLREKKWRIAMIYLDHLEKKYPTWDRIYMAKAIIHYIFHEPVFMKKALNKGCRLGNNTACDDLKNIKKLNEYDFVLSIVD